MATKGKAGGKSSDKSTAAKKGKEKERAGGGSAVREKAAKARGAQSINVRHVLCEKHGKKEEALTKLREGAGFDEVAREFSEDKARAGGALGWKKRGDLDPAFEAVAFELDASTTAKPKYAEVKTGFGYHIIMVEGRK